MRKSLVAALAVVVLAGIPLIARCGLNGVGYTMALAYGATAAIQWYWFLNARQASKVATVVPAIASTQAQIETSY